MQVRALARVAALGVTVLGTVALTLLPYLWSAEPTVDGVVVSRADRLVALWRRVFPFGRGLYEDHVANVWVPPALALHCDVSTEYSVCGGSWSRVVWSRFA